MAAVMTPKKGSNTTREKGSPNSKSDFEIPSTEPSKVQARDNHSQATLKPRKVTRERRQGEERLIEDFGRYQTKRVFSEASMDEIGANEMGKGEDPEQREPTTEVPTPSEASERTETPKSTEASKPKETAKPSAIPIQRPGWEQLIPRMSPLLGPQYQVRAQAHPQPDETTQRKQGEENNKRVQAMMFKQFIPRTAHDINLVFGANEQLEPEKRIRPPHEGTKEFEYIKEKTVAWSERRKCQLLDIIPGDAVHRPKCGEEISFLRRHVKKQTREPYLRMTPGTDGIHPERTFNGLMDEEEWKQMTLRDMHEWKMAPPYLLMNGQGKKTELSKRDAYTAQFRGYNDEFKTGTTGMQRRLFFPASHHTELVGEEEMAILQGQGFKIWKKGELMEGVRKDSEIDWVDAGATMQVGDSLFWEDDEVFEGNGRVMDGGEWLSASVANEDAFKGVMGGVDLSRVRYVHQPVGRYRERDLVKQEEDLERLRRYEHQGM